MFDFSYLQVSSWLALGYGAMLIAVAYGIDALARKASRSLEASRTPGFVYHESHDAWLCPEDQWLWPQSFDPENRVMRYRGNPNICNACPVKDTCTTSNSGREIQREVDPWPASEAARFHRGIACTVVVLAMVWPAAMIFAAQSVLEGLVLALGVIVLGAISLPLWSHLRHSPADPTGILKRDADENVADRQLIALHVESRKTKYRSDRGPTNGQFKLQKLEDA